MQRQRAIIIASMLMLLIASPVLVQAEESGGVQASTSTLSFSGDAVEGGTIIFHLSLYNSNPTEATGVTYSLYREEISTGYRLKTAAIDIPGETVVTVNATWPQLTAGEHQIWVEFAYGNVQTFYEPFTVVALPDLEVVSVGFDPAAGAMSGDEIAVAIEIENSGTVNAGASTLRIAFAGATSDHITPAVNGQSTVWVNATLIAPNAGNWPMGIELDIDDMVIESDDDNDYSFEYLVNMRMDLYHQGEITVSTTEGALDGPWTFSGILARANGQGSDEVTIRLEIPDSSGAILPLQPFSVNISGGDNAIKQWSHVLTREQLPLDPAIHSFEVVIDPFSTDSYIQENTSNDRILSSLTIFQIPDVVVDLPIPSTCCVAGGDSLSWTVMLSNNGQIDVSGIIRYTWENQTTDSSTLVIPAGGNLEWVIELDSNFSAHSATFSADWIAATNSWDDILSNSHGENSVSVLSQLRLIWSDISFSLVDENGENVNLPLVEGENYTVSIELSSFDSGSLNFTCGDSSGKVYAVIPVTVSASNQWVAISCTFTADAPNSELMLIPSDGGVTSTKTWNWPTALPVGTEVEGKEDYSFATAMIILFIALGLIVILIAAVILTRESDGEVERDIFDYCPACDGELEGDENRCPHCRFNLKKARMQFHDCDSCAELVPDLLDNCPYCGAAQDISKYFQKRERQEIKQTIDLPDEEEIDEDAIVSGSEDFDQAVQDFGYDADDLEGHWDEELAAAETEVEAAQDRLDIEIEQSELDDETLEQMVEPTLKSVDDSFSGKDIDAILSEKDEVFSHLDDGEELSASDANIRERLFKVTGEKGVMPGDKVTIGGASKSILVGNEIPTDALDFSLKDDQDQPIAESSRKAPRRRRKDDENNGEDSTEEIEKAECGVCGAELGLEELECKTCGARFE